MSQTTPLLMPAQALLGPHNHRAVHMTYCLYAPFLCYHPQGSDSALRCFDFTFNRHDLRPGQKALLSNPLSPYFSKCTLLHMSRLRVDTGVQLHEEVKSSLHIAHLYVETVAG